MNSTHNPFHDHYDLLRTGLNRIRFIKKKQIHNHNRIADHLKQMVRKISPLKEDSILARKQREQEQPVDRREENAGAKENVPGLARSFTSRGKFKISAMRGKYALQPTQEDSSITKQSQDLEQSRSQVNLYSNEKSVRKGSENNIKLKELLQSKCANYQEMKQHERQLETIRRLKTQQTQRILKEKVMKVVKDKEEGRRKVEDNYFQYIEGVQNQKEADRARKARMTYKRQQDIIRLQEEQKREIELFQSSLALEHHLKQVIQRTLPIHSQPHHPPQPWSLFP